MTGSLPGTESVLRGRGRHTAHALREALAIKDLPPIVPEQEMTTEIQLDTLAA